MKGKTMVWGYSPVAKPSIYVVLLFNPLDHPHHNGKKNYNNKTQTTTEKLAALTDKAASTT